MKRAFFIATACSVLALPGCGSGQTGSAECAGPPSNASCACDSLYDMTVTRSRVLAIDETTVRLSVLQVFTRDDQARVAEGDVIESPYRMGPGGPYFPAGPACSEPQGEMPAVGDEVFAASNPAIPRAWLAPWSDPVDLYDRAIPLDELAKFSDWHHCADPDVSECNDVIEDRSICSVTRVSPSGHVPALFVLGTLLVALRRRSRPR